MHQAFSLRVPAFLATLLFSLLTTAGSLAASSDIPAFIRVTGEGTARVAPDMAVLELTVTREAPTASSALDSNSAAMDSVLEAMQDEGVEERDLQTSNFSIQPKYIYPSTKSSRERTAPRIVGYTVRNSLTVRVRDIKQVGSILDKSVTLGVNEGGNIRFTNDDPTQVITQARVQAVKAAVEKANTLAEAAGVKADNILEISEQSFSPKAAPMHRADLMMSRATESVPVAAGENSYRVVVNISFEITQ